MKKTIIPFLLLLITFNINAQTPQAIPYQAIARDAAGNAFATRGLEIRFTIIDSAITGSVVYQEKHTTVTTSLGLFTLNVGQGLASLGNFANVKWSKNAKFLQVEMDTLSAGNWVNLGTQQMLSVPYSLYAEKAGNSFTHYIGELYGGGIVFEVYKDAKGEEHGLILALNDIGSSVWSNMDTSLIGITAQSSWNGKANTQAIIHQIGHTTSAAYMCDTSTIGGQTDWYLPSNEEAMQIIDARYSINRILSGINGAKQYMEDVNFAPPSQWYWTSCEKANNMANVGVFNNFPDWIYTRNYKYYVSLVRPIRSF